MPKKAQILFRAEISQENFETKLLSIQEYFNKKDFIIDENLNFINKKSYSWKILSLLCPFYALFGLDVYSHVRIDRVMNGLFEYCKANDQFCSGNIFFNWEEKLIDDLNEKTKKKYSAQLDKIKKKFANFFNKTISETTIKGSSLIGTHQKATIRFPDDHTTELTIRPTFSETRCCLTAISPKYYSQEIIEGRNNIFWHTQELLGKGGQRTVFKVHNVSDGKAYALKQISSPDELLLLKGFVKEKPKGISQVYAILEDCFLEICYSCNLNQLRNTTQWEQIDFSSKHSLMKDLIFGINYLHSKKYELTPFDKKDKKESFQAHHADINPNNIFLEYKDNKWSACLADFGCFGSVSSGTTSYLAPERINYLNQKSSTQKTNQKKLEIEALKNLYLADLWSLALTFIQIFTKDKEYVKKNSINQSGHSLKIFHMDQIISKIEIGLSPDNSQLQLISHLNSISQEQLNQDLSLFEYNIGSVKEEHASLKKSVIQTVRSMLAISPNSRSIPDPL